MSRITQRAVGARAIAARRDLPTPVTSNPAADKARMQADPISPYPPRTITLRTIIHPVS